MPTSILDRFVAHSTRFPNDPAIVIEERSYTYSELSRFSSGICALLKGHGVSKGDRVGILTENTLHTYASLLGIWGCGACYVPLNPDNPVERNVGIIGDAGLHVLLYADQEEQARELAFTFGRHCRAVTNRISPARDHLEPVTQGAGDLCYLLFTSGTTGKPKGVPIYHQNLSAFLEMIVDRGRYDFTRADRFIQMFELTFDLSVFSFLVPWSVGASCYTLPHRGIAYLEVADILQTHDITVGLLVPSVISYLRPYFGEISLPRMRHSLFCGEALPHETLSGWAPCVPHARIENLYGPTEATIFCLRYEWQRGEAAHPQGKGIVPIGKPMQGMGAFLVREPSSDEGELWLTGEQVTHAYWNNPSKTAECFRLNENGNRAYRTGDLCRMDQAGNFLYLGRIDNQVKIDGHRVELEEIEFHAREFCGDHQAVATVHTDNAGLQSILLFIESEKALREGLGGYLKKQLPAYMIPKEVVRVSVFPRNSNGKTDRNALINQYQGDAAETSNS